MNTRYKGFRKQLHDCLRKGLSTDKAMHLTSSYDQTYSKLRGDVYPEIKAVEPKLTDHGRRHVDRVLENLTLLLSDDGVIKCLEPVEFYLIGMLTLFHDTGNIHGRTDHQNKVARIFDKVRGTDASVRREKTLIVKAVRAHTGKARDGTRDTLKEVAETEHLGGRSVRLRELAAVLRFADELAEGHERTSEYMRSKNRYGLDSSIFHDYAAAICVHIDRPHQRIALTYEIRVDQDGDDVHRKTKLGEFLAFAYKRILKLDDERRYARFYSPFLEPFKTTEVQFNFHSGDEIIDTNLAPLKLTDKVVPGEQPRKLADCDPAYEIRGLAKLVIQKVREIQHSEH